MRKNRCASRWTIILKPKSFGLLGYVIAPTDIDEAVEVAEHLDSRVPFVERNRFGAGERFFAWILGVFGFR